MKSIFFLFLLSSLSTHCFSQVRIMSVSRSYKYDSSSVIHDSAGRVVPYQEWRALMASGNYLITHKEDSLNPESVLKHMSRAERNRNARRSAQPNPSPNFNDGQSIDFSVKSIDGETFDMKALKGELVVIHLTSFIRYPEMELPAYNELVDSFSTTGKVVFLALTPENETNVKGLLNNIPFRYTVIAGQQELLNSLGVNRYPQDLILDNEGKVYYSSIGMGTTTIYWLEKKLSELLKE